MHECPTGNYCPLGVQVPIPCPIGTYGPNTLSYRVLDCQTCPSGSICNVPQELFACEEQSPLFCARLALIAELWVAHHQAVASSANLDSIAQLMEQLCLLFAQVEPTAHLGLLLQPSAVQAIIAQLSHHNKFPALPASIVQGAANGCTNAKTTLIALKRQPCQ